MIEYDKNINWWELTNCDNFVQYNSNIHTNSCFKIDKQKNLTNKFVDKACIYEKESKTIIDNKEKYNKNKLTNEDNFRRNFLLNKNNYCINNNLFNDKMNDILTQIDFKQYDDLHLLENETILITYIFKYLSINKCIDNEKSIKIFNYIKNLSFYFMKKLNLPKIKHEKNKYEKKSIKRSSYKFCSFQDSCKYNYDKKSKGCYAHHYVHNMVYADIESLLNYIELFENENKKYNSNEIIKCCNTLSFVIKHMYEELYNISIYDKSNIDNLHYNNYTTKNITNNRKK